MIFKEYCYYKLKNPELIKKETYKLLCKFRDISFLSVYEYYGEINITYDNKVEQITDEEKDDYYLFMEFETNLGIILPYLTKLEYLSFTSRWPDETDYSFLINLPKNVKQLRIDNNFASPEYPSLEKKNIWPKDCGIKELYITSNFDFDFEIPINIEILTVNLCEITNIDKYTELLYNKKYKKLNKIILYYDTRIITIQ